MSGCPHGKRYKPLPLRRGFWREYFGKIKQGEILTPASVDEALDMSSAAQAVLISHIESRLIQNFKRPALVTGDDLYAEFNRAYVQMVYGEELRIWEEIGLEVDHALVLEPERSFTDKEAAYLTLIRLKHKDPPQSIELYMFLPAYAQAYESLLKEKYGERYTSVLFYNALREHMPKFMLQIISMDMVITFLITWHLLPEVHTEGYLLKPGVVLNSRCMGLSDDDKLFLLPTLIEAIHEHARKKGFKEDQNGRTEDRGCPVLYSSARNAILRFAIEELIAQHQLWHAP